MEATKTKVQSLIDENAVMVFSKSYCPYCRATKQTLDSLGAKYKVYEMNEESDGDTVQDALQQISGQRSVPNTYIGQQHIGGNDALQAIASKQLQNKLKAVGAL